MIVEGVHSSGKGLKYIILFASEHLLVYLFIYIFTGAVDSDHSMDWCPISTKGNSANMNSFREAMERSNP